MIVGLASQLSVAVAVPQKFGPVLMLQAFVTDGGQLMVGGIVSVTCTVDEQELVLLHLSTRLSVTTTGPHCVTVVGLTVIMSKRQLSVEPAFTKPGVMMAVQLGPRDILAF